MVTIGGITIYEGVAASVLAQFPDESFDAIITDPPETVRAESWVIQHWLWRLVKPSGTAIFLTNPVHGWFSVKKSIPNVVKWQSDPHFAPCAEHGHPHSRPVEAVAQLVAMTEGLILDPYCGAGSTLVAATLAGRQAVGIDMNPAYLRMCAERVALTLKAL